MDNKLLRLSWILFFVCGFVSAQDLVVEGLVVDGESDIPIVGANVQVQGTSRGVVTDFDGKFFINASQGETLVISYVGFRSSEISINDDSNINVSLFPDTSELDQIVVVGYGTQRKRDVVGAISSVDADDLVLSSTPSIEQALRGRAAGLQITQNSAQPGGGLDILIRGAASINASNNPLIVVDGFPLSEFANPGSGNRYDAGTQGILNSFNPNDIESIEVLKDASSTAIYGARAANGVILITTKKGKEGKE